MPIHMEFINFHINEIADFLNNGGVTVPFFSFWFSGISLTIVTLFLIAFVSFFTTNPKEFSYTILISSVAGLLIYLTAVLLSHPLPIDTSSHDVQIHLLSSLCLGLLGGICATISNILERVFCQNQNNYHLKKQLKQLPNLLNKNSQEANNAMLASLKKLDDSIVHISKQVYNLAKILKQPNGKPYHTETPSPSEIKPTSDASQVHDSPMEDSQTNKTLQVLSKKRATQEDSSATIPKITAKATHH